MLILEKILHAKKLNYDTLTPLIKEYINPQYKKYDPDNTVNIFIDFWDIIKPLYNPETIKTLSNLKVHEKYMMSSEIINIVGHYRHFFYSRLGMYTNFVFYYSGEKDSTKLNTNSEYKSSFYEKRIDTSHPTFSVFNKIVQQNVNLIKIFCEYVPHTYFINTKEMDPNLVPYLFLSNESKLEQPIISKDNYSIIISNDKFHYQDLLLQDKVLQLELRGKEKSKFVTSEDIIPSLLSSSKSKKEYNFSILPDLYPLILSLSGHKDYSIKGIKGMGSIKALNFVQKEIDNGNLNNITYNNVELLSKLEDSLKEDDLEKLKKNMMILNNGMYNVSNKSLINIEQQLIDRIDAKSVRHVTDNYFNRYPILLDYVFEGEEYE